MDCSVDFDDTLKGTISQKKFSEVNHQIKNSIGNYQSREYPGFFDKGPNDLCSLERKVRQIGR